MGHKGAEGYAVFSHPKHGHIAETAGSWWSHDPNNFHQPAKHRGEYGEGLAEHLAKKK